MHMRGLTAMAERKRFKQSVRDMMAEADKRRAVIVASGPVTNDTTVASYKDGTLTTKKRLVRHRRVTDSSALITMQTLRRKSVSGRGAAALLTGGPSLAAAK